MRAESCSPRNFVPRLWRPGRRAHGLDHYRASMQELFGDSTRGGDWAAVRLRVDGDRIVEADAPGLERDLAGLTLLEAAAVGGETLAVDALANALGPVFRASASPTRVAVAMSGGVDSAVALLRSLPDAVGVTLRLWLDPEGPDSERACCSPDSVIAARETCHRLGVPHVTLDLREEFRRAVVAPFVRGYARGTTPNPCIRCNGGFRFAELLAFARRAGAAKLATGHYARIVERDGAALPRARADPAKDQSYMLASLDPKKLARVAFPLGEQDKDATRAEAERAGLAAARKPESQEACFLAGDDYRSFLERQGLAADRRRDRRRGRKRARPARRLLAVHARPAARPRPRGAGAAVRPRQPSRDERRRRRPARVARAHDGRGARPSPRRRRRASRRSSATAHRPSARRVEPTPRGFRARSSTSRHTASRRARRPSSTTAISSSGRGPSRRAE